MPLFQIVADVILTKRAISRIKLKLSEIDENLDSTAFHEQDICNIIHSISIRAKFKLFNNCNRFHKENGIQMCFQLINSFNDTSNAIQESIIMLILKYLYFDEKRGIYTTANAIQSSISNLQRCPFGRICELHEEHEDIFQLSQEILNAVARAKEKQCLQLFEYIENTILFDVRLHIFRRLLPPPRGIDDLVVTERDELEILVQEMMNHSSTLAVMKTGMAVLIKLILKRKLFDRQSFIQVHESLINDISKLLVLAIECEDYDTQLVAFSIVTRSSDIVFAANVEVACAIFSFLIQPYSTLHFLAINALSMCCHHEKCVRELEFKGLRSFLYHSLYREDDIRPKKFLPLNLKMLYTRQELVQEGIVGTPTYRANAKENESIDSDPEPFILKPIPEYGTVDKIFEQGEPGLF
jgi:hypothetical protein